MPTSTPTPKADDLCLFCDARRGDHYDGTGGAYPDHACPQDGSFSHSLTFAPRSACAHGVQRGQRCHECEKLAELGVPGAKFAISPPSPLPADATAEQKSATCEHGRSWAADCEYCYRLRADKDAPAQQAGKPTAGAINSDTKRLAEAFTLYHETGLTPRQLATERSLLLGSERELSGMLGDCAGILGLDPAVHTPRDIVPALDALKDECARLKEELANWKSAHAEQEDILLDKIAEDFALTRERDALKEELAAARYDAGELIVAECEALNQVARLENERDALVAGAVKQRHAGRFHPWLVALTCVALLVLHAVWISKH